MKLRTLHDLLGACLHELHAGERHHAETLRTLSEAAADPDLSIALRSHATAADAQVKSLGQILGELKFGLGERETHGMRGLLRDCLEFARAEGIEPHVRDAAIIGLVQHVTHDRIAGYGCARSWARLLGFEGPSVRLQQGLAQQRAFDTELSRIAETLNRAALAPSLVR